MSKHVTELSNAQVIAAGAASLALFGSLAALKWAPVPYGIAALSWSAVAVSAVFLSRRSAVRACWFNVAVALLVLAGAEFYFASGAESDRIEYDGGYRQSHEILGYAPKPASRSRSRRYDDEELIYDVRYTIDERGMRICPDAVSGSRSIVFFGGSFIYGEGLQDDEALPCLVGMGARGRFRVYNFGFHGYGPQQMLAALQAGLVEEIVKEPPVVVFYQAIDDHIWRVAGLRDFGRAGPRYVLETGAKLVRRGRLRDASPRTWLRRQLRKSHVFRTIVGTPAALIRREDVELFFAVVSAAQDEVRAYFPGAEFYVLFWDGPGEWYQENAIEKLMNAEIQVLRVSEILPGYPQDTLAYQIGVHDRHPNRLANDGIADYLLTVIGRRDFPDAPPSKLEDR